MLVIDSCFCLFLVHTDVDIAVSFVTPDPEVCQEIKNKSTLFFSNVLLPQMFAEWFVKTKFQPIINNQVEILENDDIFENVEVSQESEQGSFGTILPEMATSRGVNVVEPTIAELGSNDLTSTFHQDLRNFNCCLNKYI